MKVRLFEIFTSLEGEGILYGTKTLFVRLAGCPFSCFYCDTKESLPLDSGQEYEVSEACKMIEDHLADKTYKVNFTGGDPLVQHEAVAELAKFVQSKKIPTYLESSCFDATKFAVVLPHIDLVKIELKTQDSEFVDAKHYSRLVENALECLRQSVRAGRTTYIKIVVSARTELKQFEELAQKIFQAVEAKDLKGFIIQPTYGISEPSLQNLLSFYDVVYPYYSEVRVVPQLHKLIGAP
ncbi:MAG: 7-carboxy-7-deazaguanine synthase QueE [Candidatus Nitrosotenuis sp.]|uniref:7-carboxy-7-deazaguanine synthase QueE n=1 Tax=Candidatus Nitrosotenuis cloacae TaxID=1603555 RepID=UPI002281FAC7|nr:7-carboxy-7-deazaguanine synthase QueE [Candidatus Nitrosotenuis cloacae]MDC8437694.1 7-carboxy-7-deazaguanine synthase QueE [Candidatus Nitrosotenuis sp.]